MNARAQELEHRFEMPLLVAALLTIPTIAIEETHAGQPWDAIALVLDWTIWLAFVVELVVMVRAVDDPWRWIRDHPLDVAIVVLTPPLLPASLQAARVLRLLRLAKAAMLVRRALTPEGVRDAAVLAVVTVLAGGAGFAAVEKDQHLTTWDGLWWAITTVTTVGYGRPEVTTDAGRLIGIGLMVIGIALVAVLTAAAAERFIRIQREESDELAAIHRRLEEISAQLEELRVRD